MADLSIEYELELVPNEEELLHCVINREDVEELIRKPVRRSLPSFFSRKCQLSLNFSLLKHKILE